jgi:hypothetical protein
LSQEFCHLTADLGLELRKKCRTILLAPFERGVIKEFDLPPMRRVHTVAVAGLFP